jgi:hypothetical protein
MSSTAAVGAPFSMSNNNIFVLVVPAALQAHV